MCSRNSLLCLAAATLFAVPSAIQAQSSPAFTSIPAIAFDNSGPVLRAHSETEKPFTVAGERGVLLGQQNGAFEAWVLPVKVLSHLTIEATIEGYTVPIDVNQQAAEIEVRPDRTVITYSHIGFTVRQIMFSPDNAPPGTGPVVLFEFDCLHPTDFTLRFTPELLWMWPARNEGVPGMEWVAGPSGSPAAGHGYYVMHSDYPDLAAAVTIPGAQPGILAPYQERPQVYPVEFHLHIDPVRDHGRLFPLLMAAGMNPASATNAALGATLAQLNANLEPLYKAHAESYKKLLANSVSIETPDKALNEAFQWAEISIEQLKAHPYVPSLVTGHDFSRAESSPEKDGALAPEAPAANSKGKGVSLKVNGTSFTTHINGNQASAPEEETALVAGYYASGDSARPGFGWFFGRDSLYTLYAINGYGDFALSKSELEFLIHRQRADGKIMHEYSQIAPAIDWQAFPYMYAAADSTPLFLLAVADYVRSSGDTAFLTDHRDAIRKAWAFETDPAHNTNGIYDNSQGTGWVESWPGGMPHQEIYLALLDQQASAAMAQIETLLHNQKESQAAQARAEAIAKTINAEYYDPQKSCYAFSRAADGSLDRTSTVYPALAWWSNLPGTSAPSGAGSILMQPSGCLSQFAASALNTDWGLRDVANAEPIYDGMSYHQGSVWPLFTGWAALAEYRSNQPLAGYQLLMENVNLTRAQDLGAVTELLSGDFNVPFGRSTSHQLWSSAMVITPTLRGLFGIDIDAQTKTITVNPHLPAQWQDARVRNRPLPGGPDELTFAREGSFLTVRTDSGKHTGWKLKSDAPGTEQRESYLSSEGLMIAVPVPDIEIETPAAFVPEPGGPTQSPRILSEQYSDHKLTLTIEGPADNSDHKNPDGSTTFGHVFPLTIIRHKLVNPSFKLPPDVSDKPKLGTAFIFGREIDTAHHNPKVPIEMDFHFPPGSGWKTITVTLTW